MTSQNSKKWEPFEEALMLRLYPKYKQGSITAQVLRHSLKERTIAAISKKYWTFEGKTNDPSWDIKQRKWEWAFHGLLKGEKNGESKNSRDTN